jgi:hypothetical protein
MPKALELDRRNCGLSHEEGQTEKRENKRELSHAPFLLLSSRVRRDHHSERMIRTRRAALSRKVAGHGHGRHHNATARQPDTNCSAIGCSPIRRLRQQPFSAMSWLQPPGLGGLGLSCGCESVAQVLLFLFIERGF